MSGKKPLSDSAWMAVVMLAAGIVIGLMLYFAASPTWASGFSDVCAEEYKRSCYPHWSDLDGDGQSTREEMLERDSLVPVTKNDRGKIIAGLWVSPYDGKAYADPSGMDLDHIIALGHVHRIGGKEMTRDQREAIANDPLNLVLVSAGSNRSKSDNSQVRWIIPNLAWLGTFIERQEDVRVKYGLGYEPCEREAVNVMRLISSRTVKGLRLADAVESVVQENGTFSFMGHGLSMWRLCQLNN